MGISASAFAQRAVELAILNPSIPYVFGGRTRAGTDCSNLIRLIIKELGGKDIQAGSNTMWSEHVTDRHYVDDGGAKQYGGDLRPGDLLFIDDSNPPSKSTSGTPGAMGHVGIFVGPTGLKTHDGLDATVVHASSGQKMVCFSSIPKNFIRWTHSARLKALDYGDMGNPITEDSAPDSPEETVPVTAQAEPGPGEAMVAKTGVRMRRQPKIVDGANHNRVAPIEQGTIFPILDRKNGWTQEGLTIHKGWIRDDMLTFGSDD